MACLIVQVALKAAWASSHSHALLGDWWCQLSVKLCIFVLTSLFTKGSNLSNPAAGHLIRFLLANLLLSKLAPLFIVEIDITRLFCSCFTNDLEVFARAWTLLNETRGRVQNILVCHGEADHYCQNLLDETQLYVAHQFSSSTVYSMTDDRQYVALFAGFRLLLSTLNVASWSHSIVWEMYFLLAERLQLLERN